MTFVGGVIDTSIQGQRIFFIIIGNPITEKFPGVMIIEIKMKFIKRRHEGEYHNTHFIMWQNQRECFRLFINLWNRKQIVLDYFKGKGNRYTNLYKRDVQ